MNPQTILKPNILTVACLATVMVLGLAVICMIFSPENLEQVMGLGTVALGAFATLMFTLAKAPPNPDVEVSFASYLLNLAAGKPALESELSEQNPRAPPFLLVLIMIAAGITGVAFAVPSISDSVANGFGNATIGMIAGLVGKLADGEPDKTVPQSVVLAALKQLGETGAKEGK